MFVGGKVHLHRHGVRIQHRARSNHDYVVLSWRLTLSSSDLLGNGGRSLSGMCTFTRLNGLPSAGFGVKLVKMGVAVLNYSLYPE